MKDEKKTKRQLVEELEDLRKRVAELEASRTDRKPTAREAAEEANRELRTEIDERKRAEERLQQSEARLRAVIESLPFDFFLIDNSGRYAMQNAVCKQRWGDVVGTRPEDVAPDEQTMALWRSNNRRAFSGEVVKGEVVLQAGRHKGTCYNIVSPILRGEEILGILGVNIDISDRKRAEEALKAEKELTETALNTQTDTFFVFEASTGRAVRWNRAFKDISGYSDEEIRSMKAPEDYYSEDDLKRATAASNRLRNEDFTTVELSLITKDGRSIPTEYVGSAIRDDEGSLRYIIAIGRDITDRKKAEDALRQARDELELRVRERTAELTAANEALSREIAKRENTQEALQRSEERFRAVFEKAGIGIAICNLDGRFIEINPAFENMLGYSNEELKEKTFSDVTHPEDLPWELERVEKILQANRDDDHIRDDDYIRMEKRYIRKNGEVMWVRLTACFLRDAEGRPYWGLGMVQDITESKRTEQALRESEERLRLAVQKVPVMLNAMDENRDFVVWNSECERVTGYGADEIVGNPKARELLYPDAQYRERMMKEWANRQEDYRNWEWTVTCKDGTKKSIAWSHVSRRHPIPGWPFWGIGIDITERKRAEEVVRKEAERFRLLAKATRDAVYDIDLINGRVWRNDNYQRHFGAPAETTIDDDWWLERIHPEDRGRILSVQGDPHQTKSDSFRDEYRLRRSDGSYAHVIDRAYILRNEQEEPSRIIGALTDITARKRAEEALRESEERFRCLMEQAADAVFVHRRDGTIVAVNEEACRSLDYSRAELVSKSVYDVVVQFEEHHVASLWNRLVSGERITVESCHRRKDGTTFPVEARLGLLVTGKQKQVLVLVRDVTERKRAEEALRASEAKFRTLAETVPAAIFIVQGDRLQYANPAAERLTGYTAPDLQNVTLGEAVYPDVLNLATRRGPGNGAGSDLPSKYELKLLTQHGRERWIDCSVSTVEYEEQPATLITGFDITERKEAEELARKRLAELAHMSRVSTMGEMATGLAHELNQPLGTITNYAEGCLVRIKTGKANIEDLYDPLEAIIAEAFRAGNIIRHTRQFLGRREPSQSTVDVNQTIREVVALLEYEIKAANIELLLDLAEPAPYAQGDHVFIQQVVLNLLRNAIEALADVDTEWRFIRIQTSMDNEGEVDVCVADNGPGVGTDDLDTLFEPYFTTKPEGMGMGLSICRSIISEHGGKLWASGKPDGGAVFHFTLPT